MTSQIARLSLLAPALLVVAACAGKAASSSSSEETGGDDSGAGGSMPKLPAPSSHREQGVSCAPSPVGAEPVIPGAGAAGGSAFACTANEQCTLHPGGRCVYNAGVCGEPCVATAPSSACVYDACAVDSDCPASSVCVCGQGGPAANECSAVGNCRVDADCASGFCSPSVDSCGAFNGYFCHTAADACNGDSDCSNSGLFAKCVTGASSSAWQCSPVGCASAGAM